MHSVKNNAASTLSAQLLISATSMSVVADVFPVAPFYLTLPDTSGLSAEVIEVIEKVGTVFTIVRGIEGTNQTHAVGTAVELRMMAQHIIELQDAAAVVAPQGDWVVDTKNLRDANASGKKVILKAGTFFLEGDGTEIIKKTTAEVWEGAGLGATFLKIRSTVPNTRDIFRLVPSQLDALGYGNRGFQLCNFSIIPENQSGRFGRHGVNMDQTDAGAWFTSQMHLHHLHIDYLGGNSIHANNGGKLDGYFCSKISDCLLWSGIKLVGAGDSIKISDSTIAGENIGIDMAVRSLANVAEISGCNITARGGAIKADADRLRILDCNIELYNNGGTVPAVAPVALVHILGTMPNENHRIEGCTIMNLIGGSIAACKIEKAYQCKITNNRFHGGTGTGSDLILTSACSGAIIYPDNRFYNNRKVDTGTGTVYVT